METGEATCIGCGCTDVRACEGPPSGLPCYWLAVDYQAGRGVCSRCPSHLPAFQKALADQARRQRTEQPRGG